MFSFNYGINPTQQTFKSKIKKMKKEKFIHYPLSKSQMPHLYFLAFLKTCDDYFQLYWKSPSEINNKNLWECFVTFIKLKQIHQLFVHNKVGKRDPKKFFFFLDHRATGLLLCAKLWYNCNTIPQLHQVVRFNYSCYHKLDPTVGSNYDMISQLHHSRTPTIVYIFEL